MQPWVLFLILYGAVAVVVYFSARRMDADIDGALTAAVVCSGGLAALTFLLAGGF